MSAIRSAQRGEVELGVIQHAPSVRSKKLEGANTTGEQMNNQLTDIEPAYEHLTDFAKATHGTTGAIQGMRQKAIYSDGALSSKFKTLGALLWSISARCEPCVKYYALKSREMGVTEEEIGEIGALASTMGGCVGETWGLKAYAAFKEASPADEECCAV